MSAIKLLEELYVEAQSRGALPVKLCDRIDALLKTEKEKAEKCLNTVMPSTGK